MIDEGRVMAVTSQVHRTQRQNYDDCVERIYATLKQIAIDTIVNDTTPDKAAKVQNMVRAAKQRQIRGDKIRKLNRRAKVS